MSERNKANIALSLAIVAFTLLAGYVVFTAFGKGATDTPVASPTQPGDADKELDVVFVIDATSSMADEIEHVKAEVVSVADEIAAENPNASIRYGLVLYKDTTDDFVTKLTPLSEDTQKIRGLLQSITVSGGGDYPEHVGAGLHEALNFSFRKSAERVIYLVGDAPSQNHNDGKDVASAIEQAKQLGVTIRTLGCSGIESQGGRGRSEFQQIATQTGGNYRDLTYHAVIVDQNGQRKSVIYEGGEAYEADRVLEKSEWVGGSGELRSKGLVRPAAADSVEKARGAKKESSVIEVIKGDL